MCQVPRQPKRAVLQPLQRRENYPGSRTPRVRPRHPPPRRNREEPVPGLLFPTSRAGRVRRQTEPANLRQARHCGARDIGPNSHHDKPRPAQLELPRQPTANRSEHSVLAWLGWIRGWIRGWMRDWTEQPSTVASGDQAQVGSFTGYRWRNLPALDLARGVTLGTAFVKMNPGKSLTGCHKRRH